MSYPLYLVPEKNYNIIDPNDLDSNDWLGKWIPSHIKLKDFGDKLSVEAISVKMDGFSINKIPPSKIADLNICFLDEYKQDYIRDWEIGTDGIIPPNEHFYYDNSRQHYFLKIGDIIGHTDIYENPPDKKDSSFKFTLNIEHKPTVSNYWHFQFKIDPSNPAHKMGKEDRGWHKKITSSIRTKMQDIAKFEIG